MHSRRKLFQVPQVRELDHEATEALSIPSYQLMSRAGASAFRILRKCWGTLHSIVVVCGTGNNAGDGYVLARLARKQGIRCQVLYLGDRDKLQGDALVAAQEYRQGGGIELPAEDPFDHHVLRHADVIIDALLGTGAEGPIKDEWRRAVEAINASGVPVLSMDVPSGLNANSGHSMGAVVRASCTVSFVGLKQGLFTGEGPEFCGKVEFDTLGTPEDLFESRSTLSELMQDKDLKTVLPEREWAAHKRSFGRVLVVGGDLGYGGAARMAAESALRAGAGLVSLAVREEYVASITGIVPELMCHGVRRGDDLESLLENADVIAVGPGLRKSDWGRGLWEAVCESGKPMVVDADALNLLAENPKRSNNWILTPHPGEAARLLNKSNDKIQQDRYKSVMALQRKYGGVAVLKGAGSMVAAKGETTRVCPYGNPGMATAGMGDVLTGVIAGLLAQGLLPFDAARHGVLAHALAGDVAAKDGQRGLLATDVIKALRQVVNADVG